MLWSTPIRLAAFVVLAKISNATFSRVCNPSIGEEEISPGVYATYLCNRLPVNSDYISNSAIQNQDPLACARACSQKTNGEVCGWGSDRCIFYNPGSPSVEWTNTITITIRQNCDIVKQSEIDNLRNERDHFMTGYDQCIAALDTCESERDTCRGDLTTCEDALGQCNDGANGGGNGGTPNPCNQGGQAGGFQAHGEDWELVCSQRYTQQRFLNGPTSVTTQSSMDACLQSCKNHGRDRCRAFNFDSNSGACEEWQYYANSNWPASSNWNKVLRP